jgi:hypothetical protein
VGIQALVERERSCRIFLLGRAAISGPLVAAVIAGTEGIKIQIGGNPRLLRSGEWSATYWSSRGTTRAWGTTSSKKSSSPSGRAIDDPWLSNSDSYKFHRIETCPEGCGAPY